MYPGTTFSIIDQSAIQPSVIATVDDKPIFATVSSFNKGPEDLRIVSGQQFYDLYGSTMDFVANGQPALQAANIINNGGRLLVKRLVATDAKLANIILTANVTSTVTLKSAAAGGNTADYYKTALKNTPSVILSKKPEEVTTHTDATKYFTIDTVKNTIKWVATSISNCKTYADVYAKASASESTEATVTETVNKDETETLVRTQAFPLIIATDNGRGSSVKAIKFVPDYTTSKSMNYMYYSIFIYEGTSKSEVCNASLNPSVIYNSVLYGLSQDTSSQLHFGVIDGQYEKYAAAVAEVAGITLAEAEHDDLIFATDYRGDSMWSSKTETGIALDAESVDLGAAYGVELQSGSNGKFGDSPWTSADNTSMAETYEAIQAKISAALTAGVKNTGETYTSDDAYADALTPFEAWIYEACKVFDPAYDGETYDAAAIWDTDTYKIAAIFDANYPDALKKSLSDFVTFREDCFFFRDFGLNINSYSEIYSRYQYELNDAKYPMNKFCGDYFTAYQIYNPETKLRTKVTMMYDLAAVSVARFANGASRPFAGVINGFVLKNAIDGTLNFIPHVTPSVNQKALLDDMRINYAIFQDGDCVVQSLYTSQRTYTELSYINNILAIQEVMRAVRTSCPKKRYSFSTSSDFTIYKEAVNNVLTNFKANFSSLTFDYEQNSLKAANKIFYAIIYFKFGGWAQTEQFDLYALSSDETTTTTTAAK